MIVLSNIVMAPCKFCRLKTILEFKCLCGDSFCVRHRLPEDHGCTIDRMKIERERLEKALPKVVGDKLPERL